MGFWGLVQLGLSAVGFVLAAVVAKHWAPAPGIGKPLPTLALYSLGNLIMMRLIREFGMGVSLSLSGVIQLLAVNAVALAYFGERINALQAIGLVLAVVSMALIKLGPYLQGR